METKAKPNPNGCLAKALPDEPMFILLARDATAGPTIRFWADLRAKSAVEEEGRQEAEQLIEAFDTADAMERWRAENDGAWRGDRAPDKLAVWPAALTPELQDILGRMCFTLGKIAHAYQAAGDFIGGPGVELKKRAEDEQAFMLHRFLCRWIDQGPGWMQAMEEEISAVYERARAIEAAKTEAPANG